MTIVSKRLSCDELLRARGRLALLSKSHWRHDLTSDVWACTAARSRSFCFIFLLAPSGSAALPWFRWTAQRRSCARIQPFLDSFHMGRYRVLNGAPWARPQAFTTYPFYVQQCACAHTYFEMPYLLKFLQGRQFWRQSFCLQALSPSLLLGVGSSS